MPTKALRGRRGDLRWFRDYGPYVLVTDWPVGTPCVLRQAGWRDFLSTRDMRIEGGDLTDAV